MPFVTELLAPARLSLRPRLGGVAMATARSLSALVVPRRSYWKASTIDSTTRPLRNVSRSTAALGVKPTLTGRPGRTSK
jgi:hypothetical protein